MNPERHAQFLRLREQDVMIGMRMRFARHHELANPSAFTSGFDRALQLVRCRLRIAQRKMRDRQQLASAAFAEIHDVAVVGARVSLRHFGIGGFHFVEQAQSRI